MKLTHLRLRNFTVFESADFEFASGINVFIGENATGKSHLLKVIYALLDAARADPPRRPDEIVKERLGSVFLPDGKNVGRLVRAGVEGPGSLYIQSDRGECHASLSVQGDVGVIVSRWDPIPPPLYLPARDVLAMYEGFASLYKNNEVSFDQTYNDVCLALQRVYPRGAAKGAADELAAPILSILGGSVTLDGPRFYVDSGDGPHEAHLVAEGLRKIAALAHLVANGSIVRGGVLLWDEPETNLNPRLVAKLAGVLRGLAERGVQIFLATHDFLLSHKLSLASEYNELSGPQARFFALHREGPASGVHVEAAPTLAEIQHNSILDEYAAHHDEERALFRGAGREGSGGEP